LEWLKYKTRPKVPTIKVTTSQERAITSLTSLALFRPACGRETLPPSDPPKRCINRTQQQSDSNKREGADTNQRNQRYHHPVVHFGSFATEAFLKLVELRLSQFALFTDLRFALGSLKSR
jgi:hypothetical protein